MASTMSHWERINAALKGEEVDHAPVSLWRHWPVEDETAEGLAAAMVKWQRQYDFDLVKFMPTGMYGVHDWGAQTVYNPGFRGNRILTEVGLHAPEEWPKLAKLDVTKGAYGQEIEAIRLAADELQGSVPIFQTVFSPLTTAIKLAGDAAYAHVRMHPDLLKEGLEIITDVTVRFTQACLEAGAAGIFFATQGMSYRLFSKDEYKEFGAAYDVPILNAVHDAGKLNLLHVHGEDVMYDLATTYPVDMINWHDRITPPSLAEAKEMFGGVLVGGIEDRKVIAEGPLDEIRNEARTAIEQTGGRRIVVGPGCVIPTNTPDENIRAVIDTVKGVAVS